MIYIFLIPWKFLCCKYIYWFPTNHRNFLQYLTVLLNRGPEMTSLLQFTFSDEMPLSKWLLPNQKDKQFYGYHKWGWVRNQWNGNSNTSLKGSTKNPCWKSSTKILAQKIPKTNKIDLQWAEFLTSKLSLKTSVWLLMTAVEAVHHCRDVSESSSARHRQSCFLLRFPL